LINTISGIGGGVKKANGTAVWMLKISILPLSIPKIGVFSLKFGIFGQRFWQFSNSQNLEFPHHPSPRRHSITQSNTFMHRVQKKHPEHYRLSLEVGISNFNNFWYDYFWHNWPSNDRSIFHLTQCLLRHYLGKQSQRNMRSKNIINYCDLKKDWHILIIFGTNIFDTTCDQTTVLVPTSPNVCFCTTSENPNRRNRTKCNISLVFFPQIEQKQTMGAVESWSHLIANYVRNIGVKNY